MLAQSAPGPAARAARVGAQHDRAEDRPARRGGPALAGGGQRAGRRVRRGGGGPGAGRWMPPTSRSGWSDWSASTPSSGWCGEHEFPDRTLTLRYGFVHVLYQNALYASLRPTRRAALSAAVARGAAGLLRGEERGRGRRAGVALGGGAGFRAGRRLFPAGGAERRPPLRQPGGGGAGAAGAGAARGVAGHAPSAPARNCALQITLGPPLMTTKGWTAPEVERTYTRRRSCAGRWAKRRISSPCCGDCGLPSELARRSRQRGAWGSSSSAWPSAPQDPALLLQAHHALGPTYVSAGDWASARTHLEQGIALYDPQQHRAHAFLYGGHDPCVCCLGFAAWCLWMLGYPDQALREEPGGPRAGPGAVPPDQPGSCAVPGRHLSSVPPGCARDPGAGRGTPDDSPPSRGFPPTWRGDRSCGAGRWPNEGMEKRGLLRSARGWLLRPRARASGASISLPCWPRRMARAGKVEEGLAALAEALRAVEDTGIGFYEPELHRLKGELLLARGPENPSDACRSRCRIARSLTLLPAGNTARET